MTNFEKIKTYYNNFNEDARLTNDRQQWKIRI